MTQKTSNLPTVKLVAVLGVTDSGEYGNARCPHCGAEGRYVTSILGDDGKRHGAMAGCLKLYRPAHGPVARLTGEAFRRQMDLEPGKTLARWWQAILNATEDLGAGILTVEQHRAVVLKWEAERQQWLARKGYKRGRSR